MLAWDIISRFGKSLVTRTTSYSSVIVAGSLGHYYKLPAKEIQKYHGMRFVFNKLPLVSSVSIMFIILLLSWF